MNYLITGGAGYIGSHVTKELLSQGHNVVVIDSMIKGRNFAIERNKQLAEKLGKKFVFEKGDLSDKEFLDEVFKRNKVDAVLHFAAFIEVGESVKLPAIYFYNNIINTLHLLDAMIKSNIKKIIFSSSAAVYGNPKDVPIIEECPTSPVNPYGYTKLAMEKLIKHYSQLHGIKWIAFRYFNASGASKEGILGEAHFPESHLIPLTISKLAKGEETRVFGINYSTKDGTCIRDYIHVEDLANAHVIALSLNEKDYNKPYNIGTGKGFSVKEIIEITSKNLGVPARLIDAGRRAGDSDVLIASSEAFQRISNWKLSSSDIDTIISSAVRWYKNAPEEAQKPQYLPNQDEKEVFKKIKEELKNNKVLSEELKTEITEKLESYMT
jgi:UDP-glucose 4-epimerase